MKYSHKERVPRTILFDDQLLVDLADIAEEVFRATREHVLAANDISEAQFDAYIADENSVDRETALKCSHAKYEVLSLDKAYSAKMKSGATIETNDLEQLRQSLRFESAGVESVKIVAGRYNQTRLEVEANAVYGGTEFKIGGPRGFVNDLAARLRQRFAASEVDHAIFRHQLAPAVVGFLVGPPLAWFFITSVIPLTESLGVELRALVAVGLITLASVTAFVSAYAYSLNFPLVEFDYGAPRRRRQARSVLFVWIMSTIAIPIALGLTHLAG